MRAGNGVALNNLRERLAGRFGDQARLTLQPLSPGMRSRIELPYDTTQPAKLPDVAAPRATPTATP